MALLNRLFSSRRKQQPEKGYGNPVSSSSDCKIFDFNKDQVRVLLFRECERRGRKLLFDSKAVKKIPLPTLLQCSRLRKGLKAEDLKRADGFVEISNGYGYQYTRPSSDVKSLGEMIFGSVAMVLRGPTFKVHTGGTPPVVMLTKVANSPSKSDRGLEDSYGSSINSMSEYICGGGSSSDSKISTQAGSCPLDVPLPSSLKIGATFARNDRSGHLGSLEADSGCYTNSDSSVPGMLPNSSFNATLSSPDSRKGSGGSLSSLRRRWLRTASTSLDLDSNQSLNQSDSVASCGSLPNCNDEKPLRRTKLGIAVIINLTQHQRQQMQEFFLEHAAPLESMMARLCAAVERAYSRKELFVTLMYDASSDIEQNIEDLLVGPRLSMPMWLGLLSANSQYTSLATSFMQELSQMLDMFETKDSHFTLVTAVLTHHLGWVPTVTPGLQLCLRQSNLDGSPSSCSLSDLTKLHPYNPLWAQAMDLYGGLGHPLKTVRTIIMSMTSNKGRIETIERLLRTISYFIRCAAIERTEPKLEEADFKSCLSQYSSNSTFEHMVTLSVDDRTSSSSTLRPLSGKCSPLLNVGQICTPANASEASNGHAQTDKLFNGTDSIFSKSETCLEAKHIKSESLFKQPSSTGLRRTMSYSSKMTSCAVGETLNCKEKASHFALSNRIRKDITSLPDSIAVPASSFGSSCPNQNSSPDPPTPLGKVIFVLGENEDLVGLKGRKKSIEDTDFKNLTQGKIKHQEQPLSFSGSEVESGFSECESFELSPVRTACGNLINLNGTAMETSSTTFSPSVVRKLCSRNEKNAGNLTTLQPTFIKSDLKDENLSVNPANLRSLARSLSVNLPVCLKSIKHESCALDLCVVCGKSIVDADSKENFHPSKERQIVNNKKAAKKLRRAHSSFCVQSQSKKTLKSIITCQNCNVLKDKPFALESNPLRHDSKRMDQSSHNLKTPILSNVFELPLPNCDQVSGGVSEWGIAKTLFGGVSSRYIPERVLQGCAPLTPGWEITLKRDLALDAQHPTLDSALSEAVAIVANIDSCEVQLISSHTYVVDRPGMFGIRVGLSQLVANMLESVYHMWKLRTAPDFCLSFLESRLQEILVRSQALSELLLSTQFCDMDNLTSSLSLEPNDVPLLLAVASTHTPEVTQRYGLALR
ncbi:Folliculin-interacting protein 2 [Frankliniella fusca]|uniref:Folliculin-interacting protein 2 n=1 Tax=Frankliniella fusca TaxID=407009 RepID=A0AAE1HZ68_9NEOP|nr:Folliculin-interacting protein 2 [Frankliniella fusca]